MGEIINLSDNIKENLEKKKEKYPNLRDFQYDTNTDTLTFQGQSFSPAGYALIHTAPVFFQLIPQDIFEYLRNGFYYQSPNEIPKIKNMITTELVITEDEAQQLKTFVNQFIKRLNIYMNNKILFDNGMQDVDLNNFLSNLLERRKVIEGARTGIYKSIAANIISNEYNQFINSLNTLETPANYEQENEQIMNNSLERGMSLTRKPPQNIGYIFPEQEDIDRQIEREQHLGIAGFTSIILILGTVITIGMYLALKFM